MTPFTLAQRYIGIRELAENGDHPLIQWWLSLCSDGNLELPDETAWCSAFVNGMAWELRLPRSKSAMARSWLKVGLPIPIDQAMAGDDVVIFWRGFPEAPTGHVGFYAGEHEDNILVLGGNQGDAVSIASFPRERLLGVRRLGT